MVTPADSSRTVTAATAGQDDETVAKKTTKPLPRAIQLVMTISSLLEVEPCKTTAASMKTIGVDRFFAWIKLVFLPSVFIALAALLTYDILCDDDYDDVISGGGGGGFVFLAVLVLPNVYLAVVPAAGGHLDLFAPQTPYAAWEALYKVGVKGVGLPVIFTAFGALGIYVLMLDHDWAWLLLVACFYLLGLLVASTIALWLCLLRTYAGGGGGGGGERRPENSSSSGEAVINGLAYLYSRLLYEFAVRFLADADADMQQQQQPAA